MLLDLAPRVCPTGYFGGSGPSGLIVTRLNLTTHETVAVPVVVSLTATRKPFATVDIGAGGKIEFGGAPPRLARSSPR